MNLYMVNDTVVWFKPNPPGRQETYNALVSGTAIGYDLKGAKMAGLVAGADWLTYCCRQIPSTTVGQITTNISMAPTLISIVRSDLLSLSPSEAFSTIGKLGNVVACLQLGMFDTAAQALASVTPDAVLTASLLDRWAIMLRSSDAISI